MVHTIEDGIKLILIVIKTRLGPDLWEQYRDYLIRLLQEPVRSTQIRLCMPHSSKTLKKLLRANPMAMAFHNDLEVWTELEEHHEESLPAPPSWKWDNIRSCPLPEICMEEFGYASNHNRRLYFALGLGELEGLIDEDPMWNRYELLTQLATDANVNLDSRKVRKYITGYMHRDEASSVVAPDRAEPNQVDTNQVESIELEANQAEPTEVIDLAATMENTHI